MTSHPSPTPILLTFPKTTRKLTPNTYSKGDRSDIASFLSCHDSEPKVSAYLGYNDLGEFWKCLFSFYVLDYFNLYIKFCPSRSAKVALELLRDVEDIQEDLPERLEDAVEEYTAPSTVTGTNQRKFEVENNLNYLMATLLYRLTQILRSRPALNSIEMTQRQDAAAKAFQEVTNIRAPTGFDLTTIKFPVLEAYNRTYNLIRSVSHMLAPSRWQEMVAEHRNPFQALPIHPTSIPQWMVTAKPTKNLASSLRTPRLPTKCIMLSWDRTKKTKHTAKLSGTSKTS